MSSGSRSVFQALFDSSPPQVPNPSDGVVPMQVGRMYLSAKEKQQHLSGGLYLYCGGHGHLAASFSVKASTNE